MVVWGLVIELVAFQFAFRASNKEIEGLKSDNIAAAKRVEELRKANDALEAEIQPRRITPEQKAAIIQDLNKWRFIPDKCEVDVEVDESDIEAKVFAQQITETLGECFKVNLHLLVLVSDSEQTNFGTVFDFRPPIPPLGAKEIARALRQIPINPTRVEVSTNIPEGTLEIDVYPKPNQ